MKIYFYKPKWLRVKFPIGKKYNKILKLSNDKNLNTICKSGSCPNIAECWGKGVATFMILGNICTRSCKFCGVKTGKPKKIYFEEPKKVAHSIKIMRIKHAVITSVDRDDLKDMGAIIWGKTIKAIRNINYKITLETLIPDFKGREDLINIIINEKPEVISHNIETVRRLTKKVRVQAKYDRSINVLKYIKIKSNIRTKTGLMLGLGETEEEVIQTLKDSINAKIDIITIGQYLSPSIKHLPVKNFIHPYLFKKYKNLALDMGFLYVESGPLIRSSYNAYKHVL
ncbi:lipoyl synthase [Candidatus Karelsulcia muelleri]|uniref:Lipoyl synthase n=1 Tax=Candidatus Karelsulcia muelleri PSPU TaxID=1189303 RepID=A0AAD1AZ70_9FLAO|nr:lipoyl synthase [Candidatus Karelsulcia muelleri]NJJ98666.1 lipoyl synthase [Candidatus Karelsulcia muelleri]BAO66322.1 lipoyl synthase [Candidatus Karelsulcia muelleri PSPU]